MLETVLFAISVTPSEPLKTPIVSSSRECCSFGRIADLELRRADGEDGALRQIHRHAVELFEDARNRVLPGTVDNRKLRANGRHITQRQLQVVGIGQRKQTGAVGQGKLIIFGSESRTTQIDSERASVVDRDIVVHGQYSGACSRSQHAINGNRAIDRSVASQSPGRGDACGAPGRQRAVHQERPGIYCGGPGIGIDARQCPGSDVRFDDRGQIGRRIVGNRAGHLIADRRATEEETYTCGARVVDIAD